MTPCCCPPSARTTGSGVRPAPCPASQPCSAAETSAEVFAFSQKNGIWGPITQLPVSAQAQEPIRSDSLTCLSRGNCAADVEAIVDLNSLLTQPSIAVEKNGTWVSQDLPGVTELSASTQATLGGVICRSAGNCSAAGTYGFRTATFVSTEKNST